MNQHTTTKKQIKGLKATGITIAAIKICTLTKLK